MSENIFSDFERDDCQKLAKAIETGLNQFPNVKEVGYSTFETDGDEKVCGACAMFIAAAGLLGSLDAAVEAFNTFYPIGVSCRTPALVATKMMISGELCELVYRAHRPSESYRPARKIIELLRAV